MGQVYLAEDTLLERPVAIKFVAGERRRRACASASSPRRAPSPGCSTPTSSPSIASARCSAGPYLVSELIRGGSLDRAGQAGAVARALELGARAGARAGGGAPARRAAPRHQAAERHAHRRGRGQAARLRPGPAGERRRRRAARRRTTLAAIAGTPLYMAPEIWRGEAAHPRASTCTRSAPALRAGRRRAAARGCRSASCRRWCCAATHPPLADARAGLRRRRSAQLVDRCLSRAIRSARFDVGRRAARRARGGCVTGRRTRRRSPRATPTAACCAFEAEHRGLFFGRGGEVRAVVDRLRAEPFVLVAGDSGRRQVVAVRAPACCRASPTARSATPAWRRPVMPGRHPLHALAAALAPLVGRDEAALPAALREDPRRWHRPLRSAPRPAPRCSSSTSSRSW